MKQYFLVLAVLLAGFIATAQKKPAAEKAVATSEKVNEKSKQLSEASNKIADQAKQAGDHAQNVVRNAKVVIKVFEPILQHFKRNKKAVTVKTSDESNTAYNAANSPAGTNNPVPTEFPSYPSVPPASGSGEANNSGYPSGAGSETGSSGNTGYPDYGIPESDDYNADGSANWGNQNNGEHGNCLDAFDGKVKNLEQGEENPNSIDLIFLAPSDGQNAYYLITPDFARNNATADAFWGSATTDNPVKKWTDVNESEVAETKITGAQFFKIKTNPQILSAVKSARGYASFYSSTSKLDGKVFAVKTNMHSRDAYALIYVAKHVGTSGNNGLLRIFIKCAGIDRNGDGYAEPANYNR